MSAELVTLGELLIDFTPCGLSEAGMQLYERNPGGAPANVAAAAARLGLSAAFVGKVGDDLHGRFLRDTLAAEGVDVSGLVVDGETATTLAFVELLPGGERDFSFVRRGCGDTLLQPEELPEALIRGAKVLHLGTLSLTDEPARSAALRAVELAAEAGAAVSCDVNYRAPLWPSEDAFRRACGDLLPRVDLLKVSLEEAALLTDCADPPQAAELLQKRYGIKTVAVTLGARGAWLEGYCPAFPARAADATGAGDCFWAAWIFARLRNRPDPLRFACAAASLCVERRGAIPAMPRLSAVEARLNGVADLAQRRPLR
ncbi:MAG: carbohydrate kinase [Oscillospiraceae bacterium]|nr:carbohydrate kinase [Oscillospiraceae bacterium]